MPSSLCTGHVSRISFVVNGLFAGMALPDFTMSS